MVPSSLLLLKTPSSLEHDGAIVLINYQLVLLLTLGTVIPVIYAGSSAELRHDLLILRKKVCFLHCCSNVTPKESSSDSGDRGENSNRAEVYTIQDFGGHIMRPRSASLAFRTEVEKATTTTATSSPEYEL